MVRILIACGVSFVGVALVGAILVVPRIDDLSKLVNGSQLTSNLNGARGGANRAGSGAAASRSESGEAAPAEMASYEGPSSSYVEEGADSKVLQFGFGSGDDSEADQNAPRLISNDTVQYVVSQNQNELIGCYGEALQDDETLAGKVDFEFAIAPDGHVAMVKVVRSTLRSKSAEDCFVQKARHWKFPRTNQDILTRFETDFTFATQ